MSETTTVEEAGMVAKATRWPPDLWTEMERAAKQLGHRTVADFLRVTMTDRVREVLEGVAS